jgi:dissimilatory sulfite reductase (desulfoviridin) alpha/beta subunit
MLEYDNKHWEELIATIIDRLGVERFLEMVAYVLEQQGHTQIAEKLGRLEHLA